MSGGSPAVWVSIEQSEAEAKLQRLKDIALEAVQAAKQARKEVMQEVRLAMNAISGMLSNFSQVMSLLGMQSDAFFAALIGMTLSTISMLISISTALAATGVGIPASVYIMAIAAGLNAIAIAKLIADKVHTSGLWAEMQRAAQKGIYTHRHTGPIIPTGGGF